MTLSSPPPRSRTQGAWRCCAWLCCALLCTQALADEQRLVVGPVAPATALLVGPQHQGISAFDGPRSLRLRWARALPDAHALPDGLQSIPPGMYASPIQAADGTLYAAALGGVLTAWSPDGALRWQQPLGEHVLSTPALSDDHALLFVATFEGHLLCLDAARGHILWSFLLNTEVRASPISHQQRVFISAFDQTLALDTLGHLLWSYQSLDRTFNSTPALSPDGRTLYIGSWGGALTALDAATGDHLWTHTFSAKQSVTQPTVDATGHVFVLGSPPSPSPALLYGFAADGLLLFTRTLQGQGFVFPSLSPTGALLVADQGGNLYGFDPDGTERFTFHQPDDTFRGSITADASGHLYTHTLQGHLWHLSPEGAPLHRLYLPAGGRSTPLIGLSEHLTPRLYLTVGDRWLLAIDAR
jgi:outer membrane protein assembly factor BamB